MNLFNEEYPNKTARLLNSESSGILCWGDIRNEAYMDVWSQMTENFWIAKEISMLQDSTHWFTKMSEEEKELYKTSIGQLAVLDSMATVYDLNLSKVISDPAVKACYSFVAAMESIHNHSYTYALSSFTNKEEMLSVFEKPKHIPSMLLRNKLVLDTYQEFIDNPTPEKTFKSIIANMILEGLFFTTGFVSFYYLARKGKMLGTATLIGLIKRDEVVHTYLNSLMARDIYTEERLDDATLWIQSFIEKAVYLEKAWSLELYRDIPDIDTVELGLYIEWTANMLLNSLGVPMLFPVKKNPMPWLTAFDPDKAGNIRGDFFEGRVTDYQATSNEKNGFDEI